VIGAVGSLVFIMRSPALSDEVDGNDRSGANRRRLAIRLTLLAFMILACTSLVVALALGGLGITVTAGSLVLVTGVALVFLW
jgi:hypothetical protein